MRGDFAAVILVIPAIASAGVGAMNRPAGWSGHCRLIAGQKFLPTQNGEAALCTEIERAIAVAAPDAHYTAEIRVFSKSRLVADLTVNGRALSEQHFAIMDGDLDTGAIQRFAAAVAEAIAAAAKAPK